MIKPCFGHFIGSWRDYFTLLPTKLFNGDWTWLTWIKRRLVTKDFYLDGGPDFWWFYATQEDVEELWLDPHLNVK